MLYNYITFVIDCASYQAALDLNVAKKAHDLRCGSVSRLSVRADLGAGGGRRSLVSLGGTADGRLALPGVVQVFR